MTQGLENLKNLHFDGLHLMGCICPNYKVFELNRFRGVIFHDTGMSNLTNFDSSTWKSKKICTLMGCICPNYEVFELNKFRGVIFDDTGTSNLTNFDSSTWKSKNKSTLMGCIRPNYKIFELKKYRGAMFDGTEYRCKVWLKTDLRFEKWYENIPIYHSYWLIQFTFYI